MCIMTSEIKIEAVSEHNQHPPTIFVVHLALVPLSTSGRPGERNQEAASNLACGVVVVEVRRLNKDEVSTTELGQ